MSADNVFTIANWFLVVSLVIGVVSTFGIVASGKIRDEESKLEMAHAKEGAAKANERAAEAIVKAATLEKQTAELEKQAAEARAETAKVNERLRKMQEMRRLPKDKADALVPLLKSDFFQKEPKPTLRVSSVSDSEAQMYAMDFQNFLQAHQVNIYPTNGGFPQECVQLEPHTTGLVLTVKNFDITAEKQPFTRLQQTMHLLGMAVTLEADEKLRENEAVLHVLRKPIET